MGAPLPPESLSKLPCSPVLFLNISGNVCGSLCQMVMDRGGGRGEQRPALNISFPFLVAKRLRGIENIPDPTP